MKDQTRSSYLTTPLILFYIILLAGCGRGTDPVQKEGETALVTLEEILRLGDESAGDTILFGSIGEVMVNLRGEIIVAERRPLLVSMYGADGSYQSLVGGYGEKPGEYQGLRGTAIGPADSVFLWEFPTNQILVYDPDDFSYVRSVEVKDDGEKQFNALTGATGNGWIMAKSLALVTKSDDGSVMVTEDHHYELIKVHQDGSYGMDLLATVSENELIFDIQESGRVNFVGVPFGRSSTIAVGRDDVLYYGWNESIEIATVSADGLARDTIRYEHDPVPVTSSEMTEMIPENDYFRELVESHEPHETKPAFQIFLVDEMSRVWIKLSSPEGATEAEWLILNRESHAVGRTTLPIAVDLEVIRGGYAYGVHREEGGTPMIVVYEIQE